MLRYRVMREVAATTLREFLRTPEALFWTYVFPVLMAIVLGMAFGSRRSEPVRIAIVDADHATAWVQALGQQPRVRSEVLSRADAERALARGKVDLVLGGRPDAPELLLDPARETAELASLLVREALQRDAGRSDRLTIREAYEERPGSRYIDWLIPGLIGLNLLGAGVWGVGYNLADLRIKKLLRRLIVTPMGRAEYLIAFLVSRLGLVLMDAVAILVFGVVAFGVPVLGDVLTLSLVALVGAVACSGLGLVLAARPQTPEGISGLINLFLLPMWLMGGSFFSNERFPAFVQPLVQAMPLTHINNGLRAVMLDGGGLAAVWPELAFLLLFGAACFGLALRLFRWS